MTPLLNYFKGHVWSVQPHATGYTLPILSTTPQSVDDFFLIHFPWQRCVWVSFVHLFLREGSTHRTSLVSVKNLREVQTHDVLVTWDQQLNFLLFLMSNCGDLFPLVNFVYFGRQARLLGCRCAFLIFPSQRKMLIFIHRDAEEEGWLSQ